MITLLHTNKYIWLSLPPKYWENWSKCIQDILQSGNKFYLINHANRKPSQMILLTCTPGFVLNWPARIWCFQFFLWRSFSHDRMTPFSHRAALMKGKCVIIPSGRILFWRVQIRYHIASSMVLFLRVCVVEFTVFHFPILLWTVLIWRDEWRSTGFLS